MRLSAAALLALVSLALPATHALAADKWLHATSAHFDMYAAESDSDVKAALAHLEAVRAFFTNATHSGDPGGQPVRIVAFHSEGDFNRYKPAEYVASSAYSVMEPQATIVALGLKPENYEKIFFEYCLMVLDGSAPKLPFWMKAGLAQLYSTLKPGDGTIKLGAPPLRSYHVRSTDRLDLNMLFTVDKKTYLASRAKGAQDFGADTDHSTSHGNAALGNSAATNALNAVQGAVTQDFEGPDWTLTHMIMFGQDYRAKAGAFIGALSGGEDTGAALNSVYGRNVAQVVGDLELYMKQSALAVVNAKFVYDKPAPPAVSSLSKADEDRVIGDLSKKGK